MEVSTPVVVHVVFLRSYVEVATQIPRLQFVEVQVLPVIAWMFQADVQQRCAMSCGV